MTAHRMLMAAAGSFRGPRLSSLSSSPHGGWTQIPFPKAVEYNGVLYFTDVNGSSGDIEIYAYTIATLSLAGPTVMHAALGADTHNAPAVIVRASDHKIVAAYTAHAGADLFVWISTSAEDISAGTETNIDSSFGSDTYTYCNLVQLSAESNKIYLFVRSADVSTNYLQMSTSTDGGSTWAFHMDLFADTGNKGYWKITSNGIDRIDIAISDDSGAPSGLGSVYHFYWNGAWRKSDGTAMGSPTFTYPDITKAYDEGTSGPAWPTDIILDGNERPRIVYSVSLSSNTDSQWQIARWTGSAWASATVVASVGFGVVDPSPVGALDAAKPSRLYVVRYISSHHQLWRYRTTDGGATWDSGEVIAAGGIEQLYPTAVKDHTMDHPAILWSFGTYTSDVSNSLGTKGISAGV